MDRESIVRRWLRPIWALDFWERFLVLTVFSALTGSLFIGFINKYALYSYAYSQGVRIPVEGVPYLDLAVTLVFFALITLAIGYTAGVYQVFAVTSRIAIRLNWHGSKRGRLVAITIYTVMILATVVTTNQILAYTSRRTGLDIPYGVEALREPSAAITIGFLIVMIILAVRPAHNEIKRRVAAIAVLAITVLIVMLMFDPRTYGAFLKEIRFGGGLPVIVTVQTSDTTFESISGILVVYTNNGLLLKMPGGEEVMEVYRERVSSVSYLEADNKQQNATTAAQPAKK